jgi:ribosomal protein S15P/S13E
MKNQQKKIKYYQDEVARLKILVTKLATHLKTHRKDNSCIRRIKIFSARIANYEKRIENHRQKLLVR